MSYLLLYNGALAQLPMSLQGFTAIIQLSQTILVNAFQEIVKLPTCLGIISINIIQSVIYIIIKISTRCLYQLPEIEEILT